MTDPIETRDPEAIRAHKAKGGRVQGWYGGDREWGTCYCGSAPLPIPHRLLPLDPPEPPAPQDDERPQDIRGHITSDGSWLPPCAAPDLPPGVTRPCPNCDGPVHADGTHVSEFSPCVLDSPPPGVTRCTAADGTEYLAALGRDVPALVEQGWQWLGYHGWTAKGTPVGEQPYIVRPPEPPAEPRTERVPWYAVDQTRRLAALPDVAISGIRWQDVDANNGPAYLDQHEIAVAAIHDPAIGWDGSGTVEVLALADTDGEAPQ